MLKLRSKEYDLNILFQFDILKEILLNLAKDQDNIYSQLNKINENNKIISSRIKKLEEKNNISFQPPQKIIIKEIINQPNKEEDEKPEKKIFEKGQTKNKEPENIKDNISEKSEEYIETSKNNEKSIISTEKNEEQNNKEEIEKSDKEKNEKEENEKKEETEEHKETEKNEKIKTEEEQKNTEKKEPEQKETENKKPDVKKEEILSENSSESLKYQIMNEIKEQALKSEMIKNQSQINQDIIRNLLKNTRENTEKIDNIENQLTKLIERQVKKSKEDLRKDLLNSFLEYKSKFQLIDDKINEINQKDSERDKKIEDCTLKCTNFDVFNMFRDSGDGSVDIAKVLVRALEEKTFKKFELLDMRYKNDANELLKEKKIIENLKPIIERSEREIKELKENEIKTKEDIENFIEQTEQNNKNNQNLINNINTDLLQKIEETKSNLEMNISNLEKNMNNIIKDKLKNKNNSDEEFSGFMNNMSSNVDESTIEEIIRKISELRKRVNELGNSFKIYLNESELEEMKKDIKGLKIDMDTKITRDNLKELYTLHLGDSDEIHDLRDNVAILYDDLRKTIKDVSLISPKVESLMGHIISAKRDDIPKKNLIDMSKYVEQTKLAESLKPFSKKFEKIFIELDSLRRDITDIQSENKFYEKKDRTNRLEEDIYNKFKENKNMAQKNKNDLIKLIKTMEIELKTVKDDIKKQQDAESWILAKQPLKCFNCASCEANIKNEKPTEEYLAWNKYPQNVKKSQIGKGFSHLLQMMTYELVNSIEPKDFVPLSEENNTNIENNNNLQINKNNEGIAQIERSNSTLGVRSNNKRDLDSGVLHRNLGKLNLPKVLSVNKKYRNDSSSALEDMKINNINKVNLNESCGNADENIKIKDDETPTIMKITKKSGKNNFLNNLGVSSNFKDKQKISDNRYPFTNNNNNQTSI